MKIKHADGFEWNGMRTFKRSTYKWIVDEASSEFK